MNYLELCQDLIAKSGGIAGSIASVTGQSGEMARVVGWVNEAYRDILNLNRDWKFLRREFAFVTIAGTADYSATALSLADFGAWKLDSFSIYATAEGYADEQPLLHTREWDAFRELYRRGVQRELQGRPTLLAEKPDEALALWPIPDGTYTVSGDYFYVPADLAANSDTPVFPAQFHRTITYRAQMLYAAYEGDATLYADAQTKYERALSDLTRGRMPDMSAEGPMA